ncbi:hypothetical protein [Curtobacterium sp. VKM Ac-1395]|uniref:hypothetical protein n=1 Tax=Curtobacterium sp. VKM Ac-1395 TaxID=2783815 RepID=UPI00188A011F|nr:hypothetical protein [Curtobacterium sp. VKM Ac-1395]MBF4592041.1 hypothetical protein [Curtobacterium sp. VKM Ac-1395]
MAQTISTIVTRVTKDNDGHQRRMRQLGDREAELQTYARVGYSLAHTAVIETAEDATFIDTLTKNND